MKANLRLKTNIDAVLKRRGHTRRALAVHVLGTMDLKRADSWISHIFGKAGYHKREIPTKYLDAIAAFTGLQVYQLFAPGISPLLERRRGQDRRSGTDRRVGATQKSSATDGGGLVLTSDEAAVLADLRALAYEDYERVRGWIALAKLGPLLRRGAAPDIAPPPAPTEATKKQRRRRGERSETS